MMSNEKQPHKFSSLPGRKIVRVIIKLIIVAMFIIIMTIIIVTMFIITSRLLLLLLPLLSLLPASLLLLLLLLPFRPPSTRRGINERSQTTVIRKSDSQMCPIQKNRLTFCLRQIFYVFLNQFVSYCGVPLKNIKKQIDKMNTILLLEMTYTWYIL